MVSRLDPKNLADQGFQVLPFHWQFATPTIGFVMVSGCLSQHSVFLGTWTK
jgi:hypothetical protein